MQLRFDEHVSDLFGASWCSTEYWQIREVLAQQGFYINAEDLWKGDDFLKARDLVRFAVSKFTIQLTIRDPRMALNIS